MNKILILSVFCISLSAFAGEITQKVNEIKNEGPRVFTTVDAILCAEGFSERCPDSGSRIEKFRKTRAILDRCIFSSVLDQEDKKTCLEARDNLKH